MKEEVRQLEGDVDGIDSGDLLPSPRYSGMCLELVDAGHLGLEGNITVHRNEEAWSSALVIICEIFYHWLSVPMGTAVAQLVEALRYKSEGRGFDSRWCHWNFSLT